MLHQLQLCCQRDASGPRCLPAAYVPCAHGTSGSVCNVLMRCTSEHKVRMQAVKKEVDTAVSEAKNSPVPEAEALWHHIYKDPLGSSVKGLDSKTHIKL